MNERSLSCGSAVAVGHGLAAPLIVFRRNLGSACARASSRWSVWSHKCGAAGVDMGLRALPGAANPRPAPLCDIAQVHSMGILRISWNSYLCTSVLRLTKEAT